MSCQTTDGSSGANPAVFRVVAVESTPNPNANKFILDRAVSSVPQSFFTRESGRGNPLAEKLFAIEGVTSLLLLNDFITVNKAPQAQWKSITSAVKRAIGATD
jgi:hypothetical protein